MVALIGDVPFGAWMREHAQALGPAVRAPLDDTRITESLLGMPTTAADGAATNPVRLVTDRWHLRETMRSVGLAAPDGVCVSSFDDMCRWVVPRAKFPLALKSVTNGASMRAVLRVQGFKDLEPAWEKLQRQMPGDAVIEDWVEGTACLEFTTWDGGQASFAAQTGLMKSMVLRPAWRQFPSGLPAPRRLQLAPILAWLLRSGVLAAVVPVRLTLVLTADGLTLTSLNAGWNRLEYYPPTFTAVAGTAPIERWLKAGRVAAAPEVAAVEGGRVGSVAPQSALAQAARWQFWRMPREMGAAGVPAAGVPAAAIAAALPPWCPSVLTDARWAAALITGVDARELAQRAVTLGNLLQMPRQE